MRGKFRFVVSALLMSVALVGLADAKKPKPVPCQPDRYLLPASIGNLTGDAAPEIPLVLQPGQSMLGSCPLTTRPFKANKKGVTTVIAKSPPGATCGPGSFKKILVKVTLPSGCQSATVKVKAKKFKLQTLQANRSFCGDGQIDAGGGEDCDGSGCPATATCDDSCKCQPISTTTTPPSTTVSTAVTTTSTTPSTTSVISTTTSTTTTTTFIGACLDVDGQLTAQTCTEREECPDNPDGVSGPFACCGDGNTDHGETCDSGPANCAAGVFCPSDCTSNCRAIGRCTGSGAVCLSVSACPAGEGCCGDRTQDPDESCDDGNRHDGDQCPATCHIDTCTATATAFGTHVTFTRPAGTTISGLGYFVDYPEGKVTTPIQTPPFGVSSDFKDLVYGFTVEAVKLGGLPSPLLSVSFKTCQGTTAPTAGDFTCTVTDASDDLGNVVDPATLSCAVTIP